MIVEIADLHIHSDKSDGLLTPRAIVELAAGRGLRAISITDHDTIEGFGEAQEAGLEYGLEVIPGVEISSFYKGQDVHILGYLFAPDDPKLCDYLNLFKNERLSRAQKIISKLEAYGIFIKIEELMSKVVGGNVGRPHIAELMLEKGYVGSINEAFDRFLRDGGPACMPKYFVSLDKAIDIIHCAGGLAVLAHAGAYWDDSFLREAVRMGIDGLEAFHPSYLPASERRLSAFARKFGLFVSGGSDCHGGRDGELRLGNCSVPYKMVKEMKSLVDRVKGPAGDKESTEADTGALARRPGCLAD